MKPSPQMQQLIEQLAIKHEMNLVEPGSYLRLAILDYSVHLIIETDPDCQVIVGCYAGHGTEDADPYMRFVSSYPVGWVPMEVLYSPDEWQMFVQQIGLFINPDDVDLADLTEYWAKCLLEQGWLINGEKQEAPDGRLPGCQSTHHTQCYGQLWQCAVCHKTVCYAEGTDNHPELCDDCWNQLYASIMMPDKTGETYVEDQTIVIPCDCVEYGSDCGICLELTLDGILAVEDKEGLRVSIALPQWLDDAIRAAVQRKQEM